MIEIDRDQLTFSFPELHADARLVIEFQRTLRIPYSGGDMPLLPSLGRYPLYSITDFAHRVPAHWSALGGAMLPMYQSEAMWLGFRPAYSVAHQTYYPFAVKIAVGPLDGVSGRRWSEGLHQWPQDFLVISHQSWLGGYRAGKNGIQQFVAMPLGLGYLPDDGARGTDALGRLEIAVYPMAAETFGMRYPRDAWLRYLESIVIAPMPEPSRNEAPGTAADALERQSVEEGLFPLTDWDATATARYTLHLVNSLHWCAITGGPPPMAPVRLQSDHRSAANQTPAAAELANGAFPDPVHTD